MNFNWAKVLTVLTILATLSTLARAQEEGTEHAGGTIYPYGSAGCGLGAVIIGDKPGAVQLFASTSNAIGMQTFAISSGTSGCNIGRFEAAAFADVNRVALAKDVVHGEGETLASFAKLIGCPVDLLAPELKRNFEAVFSDKVESVRTGEAIFEVIHAQPKLQACSALNLG